MKTVVFGSCNIDLVYSVDHIVTPGETIAAGSVERHPGGKGLNQAIALSRAGSETYFCGCIGYDGKFLTDLLDVNGADVTLVKQTDKGTGQAFIQVAPNGENSIVIYHGANYDVDREYVDSVLSHFHEGDLLVLQNEISSLRYIIDRAYSKKIRIALNPSPFDDNVKGIDLRKITFLILNEVEASYYCGSDDERDAAEYFKKEYPHLRVVLTLGKRGCMYIDKDNEIRSSAFSVEAVDTTAAGDTFTGYFLSQMTKGNDVRSSLKFANAASALAVSKEGAAPSIPYFSEVKKALPHLKEFSEDKEDSLLKKAEKYVEKAFPSPTLEGLAGELGYSESYMARLIKKLYGKPFSKVVIDKRVSVAAELLKTRLDMSVSDIIGHIGYNNENFFRKAFYAKYGMSPLEFRKKGTKDE